MLEGRGSVISDTLYMHLLLGGRTPYEVLYGVKQDVSHLHAFGASCAIVEPKERLRKLDDRMTVYFFVGYKYNGGGYRVWDRKRRVVAESRSSACRHPLSMTYRPGPSTENESVTQPVPNHSIKPTTPPDAANASTLSPLSATTPTALPEVTYQPVSAATPHRRIAIRYPGAG